MPNAFQQLGSELGETLGGVIRPQPAVGSKAYNSGLREGYTIEQALQNASKARSARLIADQQVEMRNRLADAEASLLGGAGYGPEHARLAQALLLAQADPDLRQLGALGAPGAVEGFGQARRILGDDVDSADIQAANRAQSFLKGRTYEPVKVEASTVRPSGVLLGDDDFSLQSTPEGQARIAQGNRRVAIAENRAARGGGGGRSGGGRSGGSVEAQVIAEGRRRIAEDGADPRKVAAYLRSKGYPKAADQIYKEPKARVPLGAADDGY